MFDIQIVRGRALLIYRDLAPAAVRTPGWFEDPRFARYTATAARSDAPAGGTRNSLAAPGELGS